MLGNPADVTVNGSTVTGREKVINYIRGADVLDEDSDGHSDENRSIITGDVLHSEPMVFTYQYADGSSKTLVFFGANDGMLHAVLDVDVDASGNETNHGTEAWAFIPPDQLNRLKYIMEGTTHLDFVDGSPKIYFHDVNADGFLDEAQGDQVILVCGQRKGGSGYFALDITDPDVPKYLWRIGNPNEAETGTLALSDLTRNAGGAFQDGDTLRLLTAGDVWNDAALVVGNEFGDVFVTFNQRALHFDVGDKVGNLTTSMYNEFLVGIPTGPFAFGKIISISPTDPDVIIPELGESWSEPEFGLVKTTDADTSGTVPTTRRERQWWLLICFQEQWKENLQRSIRIPSILTKPPIRP